VDDGFREEIDARFHRTVAAALARAARRPPEGFGFALPAAVREGIVGAARRTGGLPEQLVEYYLERMPRMLVEQMFGADDPAARLLWRPAGTQPRLDAALFGLERVLGAEAGPLLSTPTVAALVAARPTPAALHARGLFGGSAPLLGAFPAQRDLVNAELDGGADPDAVLDRRLSGNVVHELCHGRPAPMPWMILESVAVALGARARMEHMFPDEPGEAVPGVSLFVCVGDALARRFGEAKLWRILAGAPAAEVFGDGPARVLETAGWQAWLGHRSAPFVRDALDAFAWIKLAEKARAGLDPDCPDLLGAAERTPWTALPWYAEPPSDEDAAILATGVRALFQVNVLAPTFQTHPAELPGRRFVVDVEACTMTAPPRPEGVYGEPARWIAPPPICRILRGRGALRVVVENATRGRHRAIAAALLDLAAGDGPLAEEPVVS